MKPALRDLGPAELADWLVRRGEPRYRLAQLNHWLYRAWCTSAEAMANLPRTLRTDLERQFRLFSLEPVDRLTAGDGTRKLLFALADGETVETVILHAGGRDTVCISTQVGCPVGCRFCASGRDGLVRNLTAAEIIDQVVFACAVLGHRVHNVVVMGMGEPLLNLDQLLPALEAVCDPDRLGMGARHVTVSTSGIVPGMKRLAAVGKPWNLAVSLHAPTDTGRSRIIPTEYRYPLAEVADACRCYREKTGRMVTLEYTVLPGNNDGPEDRRQLAGLARRLRAKVNVIPCNPGDTEAPSGNTEAACSLTQWLEQAGVQATCRRPRGRDILAACGQLRRRRTQSEKTTRGATRRQASTMTGDGSQSSVLSPSAER